LNQQEDVGSGVGSCDADVVQAAVVADGDDAGQQAKPERPA
jgi:hypothetical protein